jgi:hypothetical protein
MPPKDFAEPQIFLDGVPFGGITDADVEQEINDIVEYIKEKRLIRRLRESAFVTVTFDFESSFRKNSLVVELNKKHIKRKK